MNHPISASKTFFTLAARLLVTEQYTPMPPAPCRVYSPASPTGILEPELRIELKSDDYGSSALPLSYSGWSREPHSKRHHWFTKPALLPLKLSRRMERAEVIETSYRPWQGRALPLSYARDLELLSGYLTATVGLLSPTRPRRRASEGARSSGRWSILCPLR